MTRQRERLLAFLEAHFSTNRVSPTYDEIAAALGGKSKSNICRLLSSLEDEGRISRRFGRARSITILGYSDYERGWREGFAAAQQE